MATSGNRHCANCFGAPSFPVFPTTYITSIFPSLYCVTAFDNVLFTRYHIVVFYRPNGVVTCSCVLLCILIFYVRIHYTSLCNRHRCLCLSTAV